MTTDSVNRRTSLIGLIALALAGAMILTGCGGKKDIDADGPSSVSSSVQASPVPSGLWSEVLVLGGGAYYGKSISAPIGYLALEMPYYPLANSDDASGTVKLRSVGAEFHKPDRLLLVPVSSVVSVQTLAEDSRVVEVIIKDLGAAKAQSTDVKALSDIPTAGLFLTDGRLIFGHAVLRSDGWVSIEGAHYLTRDPSADVNQPIESLDDLVLIPQNDKAVGRSGALFIAADDILLIERMSPDSPVVKALVSAKP